MAETYGFFDAEQLVDGTYDREYLAEQWANYFKLFISNGVFSSPTNQLKVVAYSGMFVKISPGWAFINGYWYHVDVDLEIEVPSNVTASPVVDGVYIRWDSAEREIKARIGVGQTTPNRVAPYYEIKLAEIAVATGATQITDANITDTRMDSSVCGLVTGIINVIDAGNLFAQYQSIFDTWMNSTDVTFDTWRDHQEATYAQWYAAIQAKMNQNLEDFDTWFENIKGQLSTDAAGHLQNEIDDIIAQGLSGSIFRITTIQQELFGKDVTITGANDTKTGKFNSQGVAVITGFTDVGTINISSTDGLEIASTTMNIPYFGRYSASIAFWAATVNLEGVESLYGSTITVKDSDNLTVGTVVLSEVDGTGVFTATAPDTYTFTTTYEGKTLSWELEVSQETTYTLELSVGFAWQNWLEAGALNPTDYESLDEVLADEKALWKLFTKHSSVDYLANVSSVNSNVEKIINNDLCAKWINLRDYALDKLHANQSIAAVMDEADKYFYGEWGLLPQVPKMTSNTAPYGEVTVSSANGSDYGYKAFDSVEDNQNYGGSVRDRWESTGKTNQHITYKFTNPTPVRKVRFKQLYTSSYKSVGEYKVQYSDDGTNYTDATLTTFNAPDTSDWIECDIPDVGYHMYWRFFVISSGNNATTVCLLNLQFYAWGPKGAVPIMTSNTAPYGTLTGDGGTSGHDIFKAFDGDDSTYWQTSATGHNVRGFTYAFVNPTCVKRVKIRCLNAMTEVNILVGNTASNLTAIKEVASVSANEDVIIDVPNDDYCMYISVNGRVDSGATQIATLQFYGRSLDVSVPVMTSNTAPFGVASASSQYTSEANCEAWNAFDNNDNTQWLTNLPALTSYSDIWLRYDFKKSVCVKKAYLKFGTATSIQARIIGSDNGNNWSESLATINDIATTDYDLTNSNGFNMYEIFIDSQTLLSQAGGGRIKTLQFYGVDYSEREFEPNTNKKWLYDHGVLLDGINFEATTYNTQGGTSSNEGYPFAPVISDNTDLLVINQNLDASNHATVGQIFIDKMYDLTNYSNLFFKVEKARIYSSSMAYQLIETIISSTKANYFQKLAENMIVSQNGTTGADVSTGNKLMNINVSSIDETAYLLFHLRSVGLLELSEIWLEQ